MDSVARNSRWPGNVLSATGSAGIVFVVVVVVLVLVLVVVVVVVVIMFFAGHQNTNSPTRMFRPFEDNHHDAIHLEGGSPEHINDRGAEIAQGGLEQFSRTLAVPLWFGGGSGRTRSPKKR